MEYEQLTDEEKKIINGEELFEEICKIETTLKCHFVDEHYGMTDILEWAKKEEKELTEQLIKLYERYYCDDNKFWE